MAKYVCITKDAKRYVIEAENARKANTIAEARFGYANISVPPQESLKAEDVAPVGDAAMWTATELAAAEQRLAAAKRRKDPEAIKSAQYHVDRYKKEAEKAKSKDVATVGVSNYTYEKQKPVPTAARGATAAEVAKYGNRAKDAGFEPGDKVWANPIGGVGGTVKGVVARISASGQVVISSGGREHEFHPANVRKSGDVAPV